MSERERMNFLERKINVLEEKYDSLLSANIELLKEVHSLKELLIGDEKKGIDGLIPQVKAFATIKIYGVAVIGIVTFMFTVGLSIYKLIDMFRTNQH